MSYKHYIPYYVFIILFIKTINKRYSKFLSTSTKTKQSHQTKQSKILNTVMKSGITYAYYTALFSKSNIKKTNKLLNKQTKEISNIPQSTTNIFIHLKNEDSFMIIYWVTSTLK